MFEQAMRLFRNRTYNASQTTFSQAQIGQFLAIEGTPEAVAAVSKALDQAAVPPEPWVRRVEPWEDLRIERSVKLSESGKTVWPISSDALNGNAVRAFLHGLAVGNPGSKIVLDYNLAAGGHCCCFEGGEIREHTNVVGESHAWVQVRPGCFIPAFELARMQREDAQAVKMEHRSTGLGL